MRAVLLALILLWAGLPQAQAGPAESCPSRGVCFPGDFADPNGSVWTLRGAGLKRYLLFDLYAAALYVPADKPGEDPELRQIPKRLLIHYLRAFQPADFVKSSAAMIKKNPEFDFEALKEPWEQMNSLYQAVKPGDRYELRYEPKQGLELWLNETFLGRVEHPDFATAYLGIWLSRYSISSTLTAALLG